LESVLPDVLPETKTGRDSSPNNQRESPRSRRKDTQLDGDGTIQVGSRGDSSPRTHNVSAGRGILQESGERDTLRAGGTLRNEHTDDKNNYHIQLSDNLGDGGKVTKFNENYTAISLLKQIETEKRFATPKKQAQLVRYVGWGGLAEVFAIEPKGEWKERQEKLKNLLSSEEYKSAERSTLNAHYTLFD
jgi:hypothetical protein